jgi:hypothetical protein
VMKAKAASLKATQSLHISHYVEHYDSSGNLLDTIYKLDSFNDLIEQLLAI